MAKYIVKYQVSETKATKEKNINSNEIRIEINKIIKYYSGLEIPLNHHSNSGTKYYNGIYEVEKLDVVKFTDKINTLRSKHNGVDINILIIEFEKYYQIENNIKEK